MYLLVCVEVILVMFSQSGIVTAQNHSGYPVHESNYSYSEESSYFFTSNGSQDTWFGVKPGQVSHIKLTNLPQLNDPVYVVLYVYKGNPLPKGGSAGTVGHYSFMWVPTSEREWRFMPDISPSFLLSFNLNVLILDHSYGYYKYCRSIWVEPKKGVIKSDWLEIDLKNKCAVSTKRKTISFPLRRKVNLNCFTENVLNELSTPIEYIWRRNFSMKDIITTNVTSATNLHIIIEQYDNNTSYECFGKIRLSNKSIENILFSHYNFQMKTSVVPSSVYENETKNIFFDVGKKYFLCDDPDIISVEKYESITTATGKVFIPVSNVAQKLTASDHNTTYICVFYYKSNDNGFHRYSRYFRLISKDKTRNGRSLITTTEIANNSTTSTAVPLQTLPTTVNVSEYVTNMTLPSETDENISSDYNISEIAEEIHSALSWSSFFVYCIGGGIVMLVLLFIHLLLKYRNTRSTTDENPIITYSSQTAEEVDHNRQGVAEPPHIYETPQENPYIYDYVYQHWLTEDNNDHIYHYAKPTNVINDGYLPMSKKKGKND